MALPGSTLARQTLNTLGLNCYKLYTQKRATDRTYKIYGHYNDVNVERIKTRLEQAGARNVRPVANLWSRGNNAGIRFEY